MRRVILYSLLLVTGMALSQLPIVQSFSAMISTLTMIFLAYIMIEVGMEFDIDKSRLGGYAVDYGIAMGAAAIPGCARRFTSGGSSAWALKSRCWSDVLPRRPRREFCLPCSHRWAGCNVGLQKGTRAGDFRRSRHGALDDSAQDDAHRL
jgi:hypothetical protein